MEEAIGCYRDALVIWRETGNRHEEGRTLNNLGLAYRDLRRMEEAVGCYRDALVIWRETGDRYGEGEALTGLGLAYQVLQRFEEAIGCYQDALVIWRETSDRYGEGQALDNLGLAYQGLRQPDRAAACLRDAAAAMRDVGDYEAAAHLEQKSANAQSRRRWWRRSSLPASRGRLEMRAATVARTAAKSPDNDGRALIGAHCPRISEEDGVSPA